MEDETGTEPNSRIFISEYIISNESNDFIHKKISEMIMQSFYSGDIPDGLWRVSKVFANPDYPAPEVIETVSDVICEYKGLYRFILHVYNGHEDSYEMKYETETFTYEGKEYLITCDLKNDIELFSGTIKHYESKIAKIEENILEIENMQPELNNSIGGTRFIENLSCINTLDCELNLLNEYMKHIRAKYDSICLLRKNRRALNTNIAAYDKYKLMYNYMIHGMRTSIHIFGDLPTDVLGIVNEYLGDGYLERIRQICIINRFFPNLEEDICSLLETWKLKYLKKLKTRIYIKYGKTTYRTFSNYILRLARSKIKWGSKPQFINSIVSSKPLCTYYGFLRDISILSRMKKICR